MGKGGCGTCCNDEEDYNKGRSHDDNFNGPIDDRSCTDIICCLLFTACCLLLVFVAAIAFARGDYRRVVYPTNSNGEICGQDVKARTKLVFFDLTVCARMGLAAVQLGCPTPQVCVKQCPEVYWNWVTAHLLEVNGDIKSEKFTVNNEEREKMICLSGQHGAEGGNELKSIKNLVEAKLCAPYLLPCTSLMGRCLPRILEDAGDAMMNALSKAPQNMTISASNRTLDFALVFNGTVSMSKFIKIYGTLQTLFEDVIESWPYLVIGCVIAVAVCLLWVLLLRLLAKVMVIISIVSFILLFALVTGLSVFQYLKIRKRSDEMQRKFKLTLNFGYYLQLYTTWLILSIIFGSILIIVVILLIWLRKRISIAIAIIEQTSKSVAHMMSSLVFPLIPFLLQFVILVFFLATAIYISSMGKPEIRQIDDDELMSINFTSMTVDEAQNKVDALLRKYVPCDENRNGSLGKLCRFVRYGDQGYETYMQIFNLFMFFWLFNFVDALCQMTLAGAFASYYFTINKSSGLPVFPLLNSFWRCIRYHLGSIAFGSLILSIVQLIRVLLEYLDEKLKGSENPVAQFFMKCLKCCFWCLEKCLKFLNRNAYILIAIYGRNFCSAGRDAFFLILRNVVRVAVVDKVADFVLFISKLAIVGLIVIIFKVFLHPDDQPVSKSGTAHTFAIWIIIIVFTYFCACLFLSVYDMGVDTLFLCFLEDLERNDGSSERPYFMPESLMEILGKKNEPLLEKKLHAAATVAAAADDDIAEAAV